MFQIAFVPFLSDCRIKRSNFLHCNTGYYAGKNNNLWLFDFADCPGTGSEAAGKALACQGCPSQSICSLGPKGPDPGNGDKLCAHTVYENFIQILKRFKIPLFISLGQNTTCKSLLSLYQATKKYKMTLKQQWWKTMKNEIKSFFHSCSSPFNCCLSVVLTGDYPKNLPVVFCPNK